MTVSSNKGLTLAELFFAAAILAFVLTGLLALFTNCIFLNETNRQLSIATSHAQYVMEEIRNYDVSDIVRYNGYCYWKEKSFSDRGLTALPDESICTRVPPGNRPLQVTVTVTWSGRGQREWKVALSTLITGPGY